MLTSKVSRIILILCILGIIAITINPVTAAPDYPNRPITYLIPFDPGGQSDLEARRQQPLLEKTLGVPVIITYKPGGGGSLGWAELTHAKPDGYTIAGINIPHIILQPLQRKNAGYQTKDLEPVALFQATPIGLAVLKTSPIKNFKEFIAYAKANPGAITIAGSGTYTGHHLGYLQYQKLSGTKATYIPFTGAAPQVAAFLGGHTMAILANSNDLVQHQDKLCILAIGSEKRFSAFPGVPTFKELGYNFTCSIDRGVAVPKGTPAKRIKILEDAFLQISQNQNIQQHMLEQGFVPVTLGVDQLKKLIGDLTAEYSTLVKDLEENQ